MSFVRNCSRNNISNDGPNRTRNDRVMPFLPKFRERTQTFSEIEKFKKSPRGPKYFFGWFGVCFTWPHSFWPHFYLFRVLLNLPKNIEISKNLINMISKNNHNSVISCPILLIFWYVVPDSKSYKRYAVNCSNFDLKMGVLGVWS